MALKSYLYTNGVIASISKKLISKDVFEKIIDAKNSNDVVMLFNNTAYVSTKKINSIFDVNRILDQERLNLNAFLKKECPNQEFIEYVGCAYDYQNLENFYKSKFFGLSIDEKIVVEGNFSISKIKDCVSRNDFNSLGNSFVKTLFEKVDEVKNMNENFAKIDFYFKFYMFENLLKIANNDKLLLKMLRYRIDLQNLVLSIRAKNCEDLKSQFIKNGNLDINIFINKSIFHFYKWK